MVGAAAAVLVPTCPETQIGEFGDWPWPVADSESHRRTAEPCRIMQSPCSLWPISRKLRFVLSLADVRRQGSDPISVQAILRLNFWLEENSFSVNWSDFGLMIWDLIFETDASAGRHLFSAERGHVLLLCLWCFLAYFAEFFFKASLFRTLGIASLYKFKRTTANIYQRFPGTNCCFMRLWNPAWNQ